MFRPPTPASALAVLAMILATGGTALGARALVITSGAQVRNGALEGADFRSGSLGTGDLAPRSLTAADLRAGVRGPTGAPGLAGVTGERGATGVDGAAGTPLSSLWAVVNSAGVLIRGSGVVSTSAAWSGGWTFEEYKVVFERPVRDCAMLVDVGGYATDTVSYGGAGPATASPYWGEPDAVRVVTYEHTGYGPNADHFHLVVVC